MSSSTSSSTAGSQANLILPATNSSKCSGKTLERVLKCVLYTVVIGILLYFGFFVYMGYEKRREEIAVLSCYECISFIGNRIDEPGLPYKKNCLSAPKNIRKCAMGEICAYVRIKTANTFRVHRSCDDGKKIGCVTRTKPGNSTFCYCNKSHCLK